MTYRLDLLTRSYTVEFAEWEFSGQLSQKRHTPKRAVLYARVSTDEQARRGYSLAQQLEALREYANREGYNARKNAKTTIC